jgi:selenoprotein W-related protein
LRQKKPEVDVELIGGSGGVFEVMVDGRLIFSKKTLGRFPNDGEILQIVERRAFS